MSPRRITAGRLFWRHVASGLGASITVAVIVFVISLLATGAPRAIQAMFTDGIRFEVSQLGVTSRDITSTTVGGPLVGAATHSAPASSSDAAAELPPELAAVWGKQTEALASIRDDMPPALKMAVAPAEYVARLGPFPARLFDPDIQNDSRIFLAFDPGIADRIRIVEGEAPGPTTGSLPTEEPIDVVLSSTVANEMKWSVGDIRRLEMRSEVPQTVRLSGLFEATDERDGYWQHSLGALSPAVTGTGLGAPSVTGVAYLDPASWPDYTQLPVSGRFMAWYPLKVGALTAANADQFASGVREFTRVSHVNGSDMYGFPYGEGIMPSTALTFGSQATTSVRDAALRAQATGAVLAMSASGPIGVVLAVLIVGCRLIVNRRARGLELAAARGATRGQLRMVLGLEGALLGLPAAALGAVIGSRLTPESAGLAGWVGPVLVGLAPAAILAATLAQGLPRRVRADLGVRARGRIRLIVEALVIGIAAASVVLLFTRGFAAEKAATGIDPLMAATPLLLALAVCVIVLRLYPVPLIASARAFAPKPGLAGFLGSVRGVREPSGGLAPILAMVVGISVAVFSSIMLSTVQAGVVTASQAAVGADVSVSGPGVTADSLDELRGVPSVARAAAVYVDSGPRLTVDGSAVNAAVLVVDAEGLRQVQHGVPGATEFPDGLTTTGAADPPVVVSAELATKLGPDSVIAVNNHPVHVIATGSSNTAFTGRQSWIMVDVANAKQLTGQLSSPDRVLIQLASDAEADALRDIQHIVGAESTVETPAGLMAKLDSNPTLRGLNLALLVVVVFVGLLIALSVLMTLVLNAPSRERMLSILRVFGLARAQERTLAFWEIGPMALVALVLGGLLGAGLPFVLFSSVDLRQFTGGVFPPAVVVSPLLLACVAGGFAVVVGVGTAASMWLARRRRRPAGWSG